MRILCARRVCIAALVPLLLLLLAGAATAIPDWSGTGNNPLNPPSWWSDDKGSDMRMGWWNWGTFVIDTTKDPNVPRGAAPDEEYWDFTPVNPVNPPYKWMWSDIGVNSDYIISGQDVNGIWIPSGAHYELDLRLANRQLHPYKLWYIEMEFADISEEPYTVTPGGDDPPPPYTTNDWARLKSTGFHVESTTFRDKNNVEMVGASEIVGQGWDDTNHSWWVEYKITPQPAWEKIVWAFDTDGTTPPFHQDFHVTRMWTGTKCTPEPVTVVLLALGLPLGILARRRKN